MNKETILQLIDSFIRNQLIDSLWEKAVLNFEIQPDAQSYSFAMFNDGKKSSLAFQPSDEIKFKLLLLHKLTSINKSSLWNTMKLEINNSPSCYKAQFIWDQEKQSEIDEINKEYLKKNPNYKPPKWDWEMSNQEILDLFFQRINNYNS